MLDDVAQNERKVKLHPHNQESYDRLCKMLRYEKHACILQPPGTGKSFVALRLIEDNPASDFLWLGPSEHVFSEQRNSFVAEGAKMPRNLTTMTYASVMACARKGTLGIRADYIILDEFHHCGAPEWGKGIAVLLELCPQAKVVGFSATEVRYSDNGRNMADELFRGNVARKLSIEEAWVRRILPFPIYICALYDVPTDLGAFLKGLHSTCDEGKREALTAKYNKLRHEIDHAAGIEEIIAKYLKKSDAKVIIFCSSIEHLNEVFELRYDWFKGVNEYIHAYKTFGGNLDGETDYLRFKSDNSDALKVLYCVNRLNEGVHVKSVDAVIMVRPTWSPMVFKQQLGQALDIGGSKAPLVFDLVNNIESTGSILVYRDAIKSEYERISASGGVGLFGPDDFSIYDELRDARFLMKELADALDPAIETFADVRPKLTCEWDVEKNTGLSPYTIHANSSYRAWWLCPVCHQRWQAEVKKRVKDGRCPYCNGLELLEGFNDFESRHPEHSRAWDVDRNRIHPSKVLERDYAGKKVWWKCDRTINGGKHSYRLTVAEKLAGAKCPICAGTALLSGANDLATVRPCVSAEWSSSLNPLLTAKGLSPSTVPFAAKLTVLWECGRGHKWKATVRDRVLNGASCPECRDHSSVKVRKQTGQEEGTFKAHFPRLSKDWNRSRGANISRPEELSCEAVLDVSWKCSLCGYIWVSTTSTRVKNFQSYEGAYDCPRCHGGVNEQFLKSLGSCPNAREDVGCRETVDVEKYVNSERPACVDSRTSKGGKSALSDDCAGTSGLSALSSESTGDANNSKAPEVLKNVQKGAVVISKAYGLGIVSAVKKNQVVVGFEEQLRKMIFSYPDSFLNRELRIVTVSEKAKDRLRRESPFLEAKETPHEALRDNCVFGSLIQQIEAEEKRLLVDAQKVDAIVVSSEDLQVGVSGKIAESALGQLTRAASRGNSKPLLGNIGKSNIEKLAILKKKLK